MEQFQQFLDVINSHHKTIKLKANIYLQSITLFHVTIYKDENFAQHQMFDTKIYLKDTDTQKLLHKTSFHPSDSYSYILRSKIIRFNRICNNAPYFETSCKILIDILHTQSCGNYFTRKIKTDTLFQMYNKGHCIPNDNVTICDSTQCKQHSFFKIQKSISNRRVTIPIKHTLNCESSNIIYAITCQLCQKIYTCIGQTSFTLKCRFNAHKSNINSPQGQNPSKTCRPILGQ